MTVILLLINLVSWVEHSSYFGADFITVAISDEITSVKGLEHGTAN